MFADNSDTLDASCENQPPDTTTDTTTVGEDDGSAAIDVLANDSDPEGRTLSVASIDTTGTTGAAALAAGVVSYSPNGQFNSLGAGERQQTASPTRPPTAPTSRPSPRSA